MGCSQRAPRFHALAPFVSLESGDTDPWIDAEVFAIAAGFLQKLLQLVDELFSVVWFLSRWHPAIAEPSGAPECRLSRTTEPDRDGTLNRQWIQAGIGDDVVSAAERDERLSPKLSQYLDLLFDAPPARFEILAERVVLDIVPSKADSQAQASATEDVNFCGLLRDQHCLPLRQDDDACCQLKLRRHACEKTEEHHRFVKRMFVGVGAGEFRLAVRVRAQHVIVDKQIIIAESLGSLRVVLDRLRIVAKFDLRKHNTVTHGDLLHYLIRTFINRTAGNWS